ncbi:hypothetical protein GCM10011450_13760 [Advenella faeciporci]|uniref:Uncharacterized protein n=1 Tax=Advenella faeciporci TaxID=797535 RepID=A0A918MY90_9BURK|nr:MULTISPECIES: hypothetical protein [Advenella]NLY34179.1 hypothetical protein [Alcaligenaceae bacterium]WKU19943.1 hypothetical protein Q3V95_02570 [Advenella alkanexedens]GGW84960.1 hypothetical protein GCM10011450_13760 [Advenella faeciporci]
MRTLFFVILLANGLVYAHGQGWVGKPPSEINPGVAVKPPVEFKSHALKTGPLGQ